MPKNKEPEKEAEVDQTLGDIDEKKVMAELKYNESASWDYMSPLRDTWDEKEAMLIGKLQDDMSKDIEDEGGAAVFDPRLATIVFERTARVMHQPAVGKAYAVSKNDIGKNQFMNLLRNYFYREANYWRSMIIKDRMMDLCSMVYGTQFALTPWMVSKDYIGPEMIPWPMRMAHPQPNMTSVDESDWFQLGSMKNLDWLQSRSTKTWRNIDQLILAVRGGKEVGEPIPSDEKPEEQRSYVEEQYYQQVKTPTTSPAIELRTEYRHDRWYTYAPKYGLLLRAIKNPFAGKDTDFWGDLPIIAKDAFPLMGSIIGLGEFERGKTLQYAINSLINLYLEGVKYSIFPPVTMVENQIIKSSIVWGPGEKWLVKQPGAIQQLPLSPGGLNTFQSTYSFLLSALMNQAGTTDVTKQAQTENSMGNTPQALRMIADRESARDEWDRVMMEEMIKAREKRWINMIVRKLEKPVAMRLYGEEAKEIAKNNPDIMEFFDEKGKYGSLEIGKDQVNAKYDFQIETGSTMKPNLDAEDAALSELFGAVLKGPALMQMLSQEGKTVQLGEMMKRILQSKGVKDTDKIITDINQGGQGPGNQPDLNQLADQITQMAGGQPQNAVMAMQQGMPQGAPEGMPQGVPQGVPPSASDMLGGTGGIPAMQQ